MTAIASPYRFSDTPLMTRERALEQELVSTRQMLDALANEEARIERGVRLREIDGRALDDVRTTIMTTIATEHRVLRELQEVREEIVARGERKHVASGRAAADEKMAVAIVIAAILIGVLVACVTHLHRVDTATNSPEGTSLGWGGPLDADQTWLYVEGPSGGTFEVDGRPFQGPNRVAVSALHPHEVHFAGGGLVRVRWIPCTTAVVTHVPDHGEPSVERFYNSSTCF